MVVVGLGMGVSDAEHSPERGGHPGWGTDGTAVGFQGGRARIGRMGLQ